jgi:hypothetical protein
MAKVELYPDIRDISREQIELVKQVMFCKEFG